MVRFALAGGRVPLAEVARRQASAVVRKRSGPLSRDPHSWRTAGSTLVEVLLVVGLLCALAVPHIGRLIGSASQISAATVEQENRRSIEGALEIYQAQHGSYPASLGELTGARNTGRGTSSGDSVSPLEEIPHNPLGEWGYDGAGHVWTVASGRQSAAKPAPRAEPRTGTGGEGPVLALLSWLLNALRRLAPATIQRAALWLTRTLFRGRVRVWDELRRRAWRGLSTGHIRDLADVESLLTSNRHPRQTKAQIQRRTGELLHAMREGVLGGRIPLHRSEHARASRVLYRLQREWMDSCRPTCEQAGAAMRWLLPVTVSLVAVLGAGTTLLRTRLAGACTWDHLTFLLTLTSAIAVISRCWSGRRETVT